MDTDRTRATVERFLAARADNDHDAILELLTDDAEWAPPASLSGGRTFVSGAKVAKALTGGAIGKIFDLSTLKREVRSVIVDGDRAAVQQRLTAKTLSGDDYANDYCWVYTCRDDRVSRIEEYADSFIAAKAFGLVPK